MSAPTPDDYRAALALIDTYAVPGVSWCTEAVFEAVCAVARAAVAKDAAWRSYFAAAVAEPHRADHILDPLSRADYIASDALDAAVAALIALAKGGAA